MLPDPATLTLLLVVAAAESPDAGAPVADAPPTAPATVSIQGLVLEKGTRQPLSGASISVDATAAGETDSTGRFDVRALPGRRHLVIQHPGFETIDEVIDVKDDAPASPSHTFRLAPRQTTHRYETVVTPPDDQAPRVSLSKEEITRTPGSFGDPFRVIESLPGVSQVVWPLAIYAIRGANPGNTGFFVDGLRVPALFHFALGPSVIHPYFLQGLDFYPGGYPARYGRYVAGAVAAHTAAPPADRVHAAADVRVFDAGALVTSPFHGGRGTAAVAARYSYTGALFSLLSEQQTLGYGDYQVRVDHALGPGRIVFFAFGSADTLGHKVRPDADAALEFHRVELRWQGALLGGRLRTGVALGADRARSTLMDSPISVSTRSLTPRVQYERPLGNGAAATLEAGADAEVQRFRPTVPAGQGQLGDLAMARSAVSAGAFTSLVLRGGSRLVVSPGFRYDAFFEQGARRFEPSPRLSVRVRPAAGRSLWLKATGGRFAQMASLPLSVPGFEAFSLRTLGVQTSWQGSLGVETPVGNALTLDASGFYQRYRGLTDVACTSCGVFDPRRESFFEKRDGRGYGAELLLRRPAHHRLHGWLAYTLSWSLRDFFGVSGPSDWDQRHIFNLVGTFRVGGGFSVGARVHYNTGRPYPVAVSDVAVEYFRLPPFYQLDLRADRRFVFDRYILDVYVEIGNATMTREVIQLDRESGALRETSYRIVLPSVGVHAEF